MSLFFRISLVAAFIVLNAGNAAYAEGTCAGLNRLASVTMETGPDGLVSAPVTIGNRALNFRLDTGTRGSEIRASDSVTLALPRERVLDDSKAYVDGERRWEFAIANRMKFGELNANFRLLVAPENGFEPEISGILGADFLRAFDVEFDFAKSRVNLFSPDHCEGGVVYWTQSGAAKIPIRLTVWGDVMADAELDGKSVGAVICTGLPKSYMLMASGNTKFGLPDKDWKVVQAGQTHNFSRLPTIYEHVFKSLTLDGIEIHNADITILSGGDVISGAELHIGMDILRQLHLYIAYKERNIYASGASAH